MVQLTGSITVAAQVLSACGHECAHSLVSEGAAATVAGLPQRGPQELCAWLQTYVTRLQKGVYVVSRWRARNQLIYESPRAPLRLRWPAAPERCRTSWQVASTRFAETWSVSCYSICPRNALDLNKRPHRDAAVIEASQLPFIDTFPQTSCVEAVTRGVRIRALAMPLVTHTGAHVRRGVPERLLKYNIEFSHVVPEARRPFLAPCLKLPQMSD